MAWMNEFERPCFGVACPNRGSCRRYHAVDKVGCDVTTQGTCLRNGEYDDYMPVSEMPRRRMRLHPSAELIQQCVAWASRGHLRNGATAHGRA
jgi:hypothetical protein